jgi:hypothetical protein
MIGYIDKQSANISVYQPSNEVAFFTKKVKEDYQTGTDILQKPWVELNNRSVIDDENRGQMMFNALVDTSIEDPNEAWKWRGTRSMARNKGIAMHANLTGNYLLPSFSAQNENDEIDRNFSEVMQDIIEWMCLPTNSNYQSSFLQVVFGSLTNPVTFLGAEYCEVFQKIKEKTDQGYETKEVLDEVLSGFQAPIYSSSQVLINNAYERNIQKQRFLIKRRWVEKDELEAKYGEHEHWAFVQSGQKSIYDEETGLFYDVKDDEHPTLVAEETYSNRREDTEVCFVGGIYMGDDNVDHNPIKHRDNRNNPKYNITPFGYHRIGEHFFYYKSMMNSLGWDNMLYDAMSEVFMNRALLEAEMPIAISGSDQIDSSVIFPNSVVAFADKDVKASPLLPNSNLSGLQNALIATEKSIADGSVSETISGGLPDASQKAFSVAQAQANSKRLISAVGKSVAESVIKYGDLMKDIAINHYTVPQVDMLVGGKMKLKYRTFMLENKAKGGRVMNKKIKFDDTLVGKEMTDDEKVMKEMELLEESGYPENKESIILVNPEMFANFKYLSKVDVQDMFARTDEYWQQVLTNLKQVLANDPTVNQEALTRRLLSTYFKSESDDFINKQPATPPQDFEGQEKGSNPLGEMVKNKQMSNIVNDVMV